MIEGKHKPVSFRTPEEENAYLRAELARRERELMLRDRNADHIDSLHLGKEMLREYAEHDPSLALHNSHRMTDKEVQETHHAVSTAPDKVSQYIQLARERGIRNTLSVLEKLNDPFITDEVHSKLIEDMRSGRRIADVREGTPLWSILHMTLFEVTLPESDTGTDEKHSIKELVSAMEQFYAGMRTVSERTSHREHFTLEIAVSDKSDHIVFYAAVPTESIHLFEKHILSLYPHAVLTEQKHDYNIFVNGGVSLSSHATLRRHPLYPLRTYESFDHDTLSVLLNAFSNIPRDGAGAALQITLRAGSDAHQHSYRTIMRRIREGESVGTAISRSTFTGEFMYTVKDLFSNKKKEDRDKMPSRTDEEILKVFEEKVASPILEANMRIVVSAKSEHEASMVLSDIESSFNQFENTNGNRIEWKRCKGGKAASLETAFSFREFNEKDALALSHRELATLMHFPVHGVSVAPEFKQSHAKTAPAPVDMPTAGTLIGKNAHRGKETDIYITDKDRLRHLYVIGQTGTGKSVLLKNLVIDDINAGHGVCYIDPHGTDITDILSAIPPEREKDVIYFDPAHMDRVVGLNMLEYDQSHPEQKTFVINELLEIFNKLYDMKVAGGPMFEQYFRNATGLVLEDPESGSTLLDISRVLSDAQFRKKKLEKCHNPVVAEFWQKIATQAGGDASLENVVPYITSKVDVFTGNDYMRPIIGQQHSAFNFRELMDTKKILLVNLSKGRLGDINANLIGMIIVGKILMAALSRVDDITQSYPPFYLHIDEFQNITTNSISSILSEARKYKLGLTIAHQFIAQINEDIRDAIFGNVGSIVAFRVGSDDAEFLQKQFTPVFDSHDLMNIQNWNAYVRLLANGTPTKPFNLKTLPPHEGDPTKIRRMMEASYDHYGVPRRKIEMMIAARYQQ